MHHSVISGNIPTLEEFLTVNNNRKVRIFEKSDYELFISDLHSILCGEEDYIARDCGAVAANYKYRAYTSAYCIYRWLDGIHILIREVRCNNRHAECLYYRGERQYRADYRKAVSEKHLEEDGENNG